MPWYRDFIGNSSGQTFSGARNVSGPSLSLLQPRADLLIPGKTRFNPQSSRLAQFNEFYRQCSRRPLPCSRTLSRVSTPDRMLFIIGSEFVDSPAVVGVLVTAKCTFTSF